jgi:DNA mismatch repair protein MutL
VHEAIGGALRDALRQGGPGEKPVTGADAEPAVAETVAQYAENGSARETARLRLVPARGERESEPGLFGAEGLFSSLRIVGQVFDGYLVCQGDGEIILIDQHAAHERVAFERLRAARRESRVESQVMLMAQPVELEPGAAEILATVLGELADCGLEIEPFGDRTVVVRATPALLPPEAIGPLVRAIAAELSEVEGTRAIEERSDRLLATIACHSVVRVGQKLSEAEMKGLLAAMDSVDLNSNCPHGRPVSRRIPRVELERRFGR